MTTTTSVLLALAVLPLAADAHGYMTKPPSRSDLAHETYVPENPEFCPYGAVWKSTSESTRRSRSKF